MKLVWLRWLLPFAPVLSFSQALPVAEPTITRAIAVLNGVYSPRGFFNVTVRLYRLPGADAAKYDLKKSQITVDFAPDVHITQEDMRRVMISAGYKPGLVSIETLALSAATETGPGWVKLKHPSSHHAVVRWFQLNF